MATKKSEFEKGLEELDKAKNRYWKSARNLENRFASLGRCVFYRGNDAECIEDVKQDIREALIEMESAKKDLF